jgi:hypothetical protein
MPALHLIFDNINASAQVGDTMYYTEVTNTSEFTVGSYSVTKLGRIKDISTRLGGGYEVVCEIPPLQSWPDASASFFFFGKNNIVNTSSIKGYYAEVKFTNNSFNGSSELFSIGLEVNESSK